MKHLTFLFSMLVLLCSTVSAQKQTSIPWSSGYQLTWADFKGPIDQQSPFKASTTSAIKFGWRSNKDGGIEITNVATSFLTDKSWKKGDSLTADLLKHEQIHFDIAEVYTRKLRQSLAQYTATHRYSASSKKELNDIYEANNREKQFFNRLYDEETEHSINDEQQQKWNTKIAAMLLELKDFER